jgi:hypothetical protein
MSTAQDAYKSAKQATEAVLSDFDQLAILDTNRLNDIVEVMSTIAYAAIPIGFERSATQ